MRCRIANMRCRIAKIRCRIAKKRCRIEYYSTATISKVHNFWRGSRSLRGILWDCPSGRSSGWPEEGGEEVAGKTHWWICLIRAGLSGVVGGDCSATAVVTPSPAAPPTVVGETVWGIWVVLGVVRILGGVDIGGQVREGAWMEKFDGFFHQYGFFYAS